MPSRTKLMTSRYAPFGGRRGDVVLVKRINRSRRFAAQAQVVEIGGIDRLDAAADDALARAP